MATAGLPRRAALYARVSTRNGQSPENQLAALREVASRAGWDVVGEFVDHGISGAKGRDQRPAFDRLCKAITRREVDLVAGWSVDRFGRSLQNLVAFLQELQAANCDLYLHVQGLDTTTPSGRALFGMLGVFAEFERAIIQERIHAGLARARARGTKLGNPGIPKATESAVIDGLAVGKPKRQIARELGVDPATVRRVVRRGTGD
jgi:DNA invertase Pin-like site-specific DNA recombinase